MIRNLKIKNCLSFLDETELNFLVNNKAPATAKYQDSALDGERISKVTSIVGANASGKSNLLRVIGFLKWLLLDSFGKKPDRAIPLLPFLLKPDPFDSSEIEVEFEKNAIIYKYKVILSQKIIFSEVLEILDLNQSNVERRRFKQFFSRVFDEKIGEYIIKSNPEFSLSEGIREISKKRTNASLISAAIFSSHEPSMPIKKYWGDVTMKIKQFGERHDPLELLILETSEFYNNNKHFKLSMEEVMAKCDLGLLGIDIKKVSLPKEMSGDEERVLFMPYGRHSGLDGKEYTLSIDRQSRGTQQIYVLMSTLLPVLASGGIAVIDELEADLHPELLPALIDLFVSPKSNPKGAQLIFTCHATPLLNVLDKYQIIITEKGTDGVSEAWRLDEIEGVRNDENFFAKYTSGTYGGVPRPGKLSDVPK
jgi:uncharacterized protein